MTAWAGVVGETFLIGGLTLLLLVGLGVWSSLMVLPRALRPVRLWLTPILGFSLFSALTHWLDRTGLPLSLTAWPLFALAMLGLVFGLVRTVRARRGLNRRNVLLATLGIAAFTLAVALPLWHLGFLTTIGGTSDGISYAVRSEHLQHTTLYTPPPPTPGMPTHEWVRAQLALLRAGDVYFLGWVGLLAGKRSFETGLIVPGIFAALLPAIVYLAARLGFKLRFSSAILAAVLIACHNLLLWPLYDNFVSQAMALPLCYALLAVAGPIVNRPTIKGVWLLAALLTGLASLYPVFAAATLGALGLFTILRSISRRHPLRGSQRRRAGALGVLLLPLFAMTWSGPAVVRAFKELVLYSRLALPGADGVLSAGTGNIFVFPLPVEMFGLLPHGEVGQGLYVPRTYGFATLFLCALLCLLGVWKLRASARPLAWSAILVFTALALHQRFIANWPKGYAYGYFKAAGLLAPALVLLALAGLEWLWRTRRPLPQLAAGGVAALLLIVNVYMTWRTQRHVIDRCPACMPVSRDLIDAAQAARQRVDRDAWLSLDLEPGMRQNWLGYLLDDHQVRYVEPLANLNVTTHSEASRSRVALIDRELAPRRHSGSAALWYSPTRTTQLWGNLRYELRERRDAGEIDFADASWRPSESLTLELDAHASFLEASRLGRMEKTGLSTHPRTAQLQLLSPAKQGQVWLMNRGDRVDLPAGAWTVDVDLACADPQGKLDLRQTEPGFSLAHLDAIADASVPTGQCLSASPQSWGGLVTETSSSGKLLQVQARLVRPAKQQSRTFRMSVYAFAPARDQLYGIWSLDFLPGHAVHEAELAIDLETRTATANLDGRLIQVPVLKSDASTGDFEIRIVWWELAPDEQISQRTTTRFSRSETGVVTLQSPAADEPVLLLDDP